MCRSHTVGLEGAPLPSKLRAVSFQIEAAAFETRINGSDSGDLPAAAAAASRQQQRRPPGSSNPEQKTDRSGSGPFLLVNGSLGPYYAYYGPW